MKAILVQETRTVELELSSIKRIFAVSQCCISVLKNTGETLIGSLIEFKR